LKVKRQLLLIGIGSGVIQVGIKRLLAAYNFVPMNYDLLDEAVEVLGSFKVICAGQYLHYKTEITSSANSCKARAAKILKIVVRIGKK
jgi:hypothetical protein